MFFFFSRRRRHTRFKCDWSSDVCSSDLPIPKLEHAAFQDRSLRRMLEFRDRRQAGIVFVSHNLAAVELMCQRAVWLDHGRSEERRVGEEGRSRWAADHLKKKENTI